MHRQHRRHRRRMLSLFTSFACVFGMLAAMLPGTTASASWDNPQVLPASPDQAYVVGPRTDGTTVVWSNWPADQTPSVVYGADIASGTLFPISDGARSAWRPDIVAGVVVWEEVVQCVGCSGDIEGMVLASGERFTVVATEEFESQPALSDTWVVWVSSGEAAITIRARRLHSADAPIILATVEGFGLVRGLAIDGTRVAWTSASWEDQGFVRTLYAMEIGDAEPTEIRRFVEVPLFADHGRGHEGDPGTESAVQLQHIVIGITGDLLVTIDAPHSTLFEWNFVTGAVHAEYLGGRANSATADGRYVIWVDERDPGASGMPRVDLRGLDRETQHVFHAAGGVDRGIHGQPHLSGDVLTWMHCREHACDVLVSRVSERLPTVPRVLTSADPDVRAFPQTGHSLIGGFRRFWEQQGGLPIFGLPLSEEFIGYSIDRGVRFTMQFTERQRFEWHPDLAGTRYEVQLGRLGAEVLIAQGRPWEAFPRADPTTPHYVSATGHAIDERFHAYWSSHGLEMGDAGVSYLESLALFGYPISPAMLETNADGDAVLTQYFERAVFEWHPENAGTPYEVLLRRVGYELLVAQGWIMLESAEAQ